MKKKAFTGPLINNDQTITPVREIVNLVIPEIIKLQTEEDEEGCIPIGHAEEEEEK